MRAAWLMVVLALAAPACSIRHISSGPPLPDAARLVPGETTKAQALAWLGAPHIVRRQYDGDLLVWQRTDSHTTFLQLVPFVVLYERTRGDLRLDQLALLFDEAGVLSGFGESRDIDD